MRFEQIRYLEAALRTGSFRQAAVELRVAQPTISTQVQRLEEDLGVVLLIRGTHGVRATYAAEQLMPQFRTALRAEHAMRQQASSIGGLREGRITLAAVSAASQTILPRVVHRLQSEHPNIHFQVTETGSHSVHAGVADGRYDAGLMTRPIGPAADNMRYIDLAEGQHVLAVPERHPLASKSAICGADLEGQPVIVFTLPSLNRQAFEMLTEGVAINPVYYTDSPETAQRMVRAGVGIAIGNTLAVSTRSGDGAVLVPLQGDAFGLKLSVVLRPDEQPSPALATFLQLLREEHAAQ